MTFDDPGQFLDYVPAHDIRVAILDVAMPGLSGIQLQKQLYRFSPETRVIIMTGRPDSEIRALALNGSAFAFLASRSMMKHFFRQSVAHLAGRLSG